MRLRFIPVTMLLSTLVLASPMFASPAGTSTSASHGDADKQIAVFAADAVAAQRASVHSDDLSVTSADLVAGYRPFSQWPFAEKWTMLYHLEKQSQTTPAIAEWLKQNHPLRQTEARFELLPQIGIESQAGSVAMVVSEDSSVTSQKLAAFIADLTPEQKSKLFANNLRLSLSDLTDAQRQEVVPILQAMSPLTNGTPVNEFPDAKLYFRFQYNVWAKPAGDPNAFETIIGVF